MKKPNEDTVKIVMNVLRQMAATFTQATMGAWLTCKQLRIDDEAIRTIVKRVMRNLSASGMLERAWTKEKPPHRLYRPTEAGWTLLHGLDKEDAEGIYLRFGATTPKSAAGTCSSCGGGIKDRRKDARVCWGCANPIARVRANVDHLPRMNAYYEGMQKAYVTLDRQRVRAARRALVNKPPARAAAAVVKKNVVRKMRNGLTFDEVMQDARYIVAATPGVGPQAMRRQLKLSSGSTARIRAKLREEGLLGAAKVGRLSKAVLAKALAAPRVEAHGPGVPEVLAALANEVVRLRKQVVQLTGAQEQLREEVTSIRVRQAKLPAPNGAGASSLAAVLSLLAKEGQS